MFGFHRFLDDRFRPWRVYVNRGPSAYRQHLRSGQVINAAVSGQKRYAALAACVAPSRVSEAAEGNGMTMASQQHASGDFMPA